MTDPFNPTDPASLRSVLGTQSTGKLQDPLAHLSPEQRALLAQTIGSPAYRRALSIDDPAWFDTYYCDMAPADHRSNWFRIMDRSYQEARESGEKRGVMFLGPRNHGKTEAVISYITRLICLNRNIRILLVAQSADVSNARLQRIQALLKSEKIRADWCTDPDHGYVPFDTDANGKALEWNKTQVIVQRTNHSVDPTLRAAGVGGSIIGSHPDIVIFDDVETDKSVLNAKKRKQTKDWLSTAVWPALNPGGLCIAIGTRKHNDDLYAMLLKHTAFSNIVDPALFYYDEEGNRVAYRGAPEHIVHMKKDAEGKEVLDYIELIDKRAQALWPGTPPIGYSVEHLLIERFNQTQTNGGGGAAFAREYQHIVTSDANAIVKLDWLTAAKTRGKHLMLYAPPIAVDSLGQPTGQPLDLRIVQGWDLSLVIDPAHAERKDTDYTVGVTLAIDRNTKDRYLLGITAFRGKTPNEMAALVEQEYVRMCDLGLPPEMVLMERNSFGLIHYYNFSQNLSIPFAPHDTTGSNKHDQSVGVPLLRNLFENRRYIFPTADPISATASDDLCTELHEWGTAAHDDKVMALWIAESALRQHSYTGAVPVSNRNPEPTSSAEPGATQGGYLGQDAAKRPARGRPLIISTGEATPSRPDAWYTPDVWGPDGW